MKNIINSSKTIARSFGIFFLAGYVAYALGNILVQSIINSPDVLINIYNNKTIVIVGAILMSIVETFFNMGLVVIILPTLKKYSKIATYGYLSAAIMATVMLVFGSIFLLLLIPLSDEFVKAGTAIIPYFQTLSIICERGNYFAYQIGMAIWGLGGLLFCYLLYQSKLVPRQISVWGYIGYIIFISGTILELFGYNVGLLFDIPGGLFEVVLSIWLIAKGFNSTAFIYGSSKADN
jgi:hypothetical protein